MTIPARRKAWAILQASDCKLDGQRQWLAGHMFSDRPLGPAHWALFHTRREARSYVREHLGYIAKRPDLRAEPHGWKIPKVVRVEITVEVVE
jgi:hypothetical protein